MPTLEEAVELGSQYYVTHPIFPLDKTVADINIDAWPIIGRARDMTVVGAGQSQLEDDLKQVLSLQGRELTPEATPQYGFYFRSDHFSFAKAGVPALIVGPGLDLIEGGRPAGLDRLRRLHRAALPYAIRRIRSQLGPQRHARGHPDALPARPQPGRRRRVARLVCRQRVSRAARCDDGASAAAGHAAGKSSRAPGSGAP